MKILTLFLFIVILIVGCDGKRGYDGITGPTGYDGRAGTDGCDFGELKDSDTGECVPDRTYSPFNPDEDICLNVDEFWNYDTGHCYDSTDPSDPNYP